MAAHVAGEQAGRLVTAGHYNGKIEAPRLSRRALAPGEAGDLVGAWDFAREIPGDEIVDVSGNGLDGVAVNLPARAMKGHLWNGEVHRWSEKPEHYAAIHFHDDDLYDAGWEADFEVAIPADMKSGTYAVKLTAGEPREDGGYEGFRSPSSCCRRGEGDGAGGVPGLDRHLHGLCQQPSWLGRSAGRDHLRLAAGVRADQPVPQCAARVRRLHLRRAYRRQRLLLQLAAAPDPEHAAEILAMELQCRPPHHRLAGGERAGLRRHHRRGSACRGTGHPEATARTTGTHPEYHTRRMFRPSTATCRAAGG